MGSLAIVRPASILQSLGSNIGPAYTRLLTPDPKEAFSVASGVSWFDVDFGSPIAVDTLFAGYHPAGLSFAVHLERLDAVGGGGSRIASGTGPAPGYGPPNHSLTLAQTPVTTRYVRIVFDNPGDPFLLGVVAVGERFVATWGQEWGAGRLIEDTGSVERLFGGGFGIDDGTAAGGYQWTLGDLQPDELRKLYRLVKDRRTTRSVLVIEDLAPGADLNERIHWGLFRKLEAYERLDPLNTKWSLQIGDWA